jgi:hypothetical protein
MDDDHDDDNEVDVAEYFMQEASDLSAAEDLNGTLKRFGLCIDDRINRRELVLMFRAVNKEMEKEIYRLANNNKYADAKEMRSRLARIRSEFDSLQTTVVNKNQTDQYDFLERAISEINADLSSTHRLQATAIRRRTSSMEDDQRIMNEIEWENLELSLSRITRPSVKFSKRVIELLKTENGLIKLNQYDEARKVRLLLDKLIPGESEKFNMSFDAMLELKRRNLRNAQVNSEF